MDMDCPVSLVILVVNDGEMARDKAANAGFKTASLFLIVSVIAAPPQFDPAGDPILNL
jgi:hypothetical protein